MKYHKLAKFSTNWSLSKGPALIVNGFNYTDSNAI